jgi:type I restriction enzyme M protein
MRHNPHLEKKQKRHLKLDALRGVELVDGVARLCAMNLLLHGMLAEVQHSARLVG